MSLLVAQKLAPHTDGPLLIVAAGVQGRAHLEAFHAGLGLQEVWVASRNPASADALVRHAQTLGLRARRVDDADAALADCPLVVSTTLAQQVALRAMPRTDAFVAAVGAFTPAMMEWDAAICRPLAAEGTLVVDSRDADHEAGDLLQAGSDVSALPTLADVVLNKPAWTARSKTAGQGPIFFKSCGWGGWNLAAACCVTDQEKTMIQRFEIGARMSEMAVHNGTVYLTGQVADNASLDIQGQTRQVLAAIDALLARRQRQDQDTPRIHGADISG